MSYSCGTTHNRLRLLLYLVMKQLTSYNAPYWYYNQLPMLTQPSHPSETLKSIALRGTRTHDPEIFMLY